MHTYVTLARLIVTYGVVDNQSMSGSTHFWFLSQIGDKGRSKYDTYLVSVR